MPKLTVRDLLASKGKRKITLSTAHDAWTARAAEEAGIDMLVTWSTRGIDVLRGTVAEVRAGAPNTFLGVGLPLVLAYSSESEALRLAGECRVMGADAVYATGLVVEKFAALARQRFPAVAHAGYLPIQDTWFGGPRAVGKTCDEALKVMEDALAFERAGVIAVELECVPRQVAAEITRRIKPLTLSLGSGPDCDGQFLFSSDLLGTNLGHYPRHSKTYARLMHEAVGAFGQFRKEVAEGAYPEGRHSINMKEEEYGRFQEELARRGL